MPISTTTMENEAYRTSTQFMHWSFSKKTLASSRRKTTRKLLSHLPAASPTTPPTLTAEDLAVYQRYILYTAHTLATRTFQLPTNVVYTALIYLQRFYLNHSPLTYNPLSIIRTIIFLTTKTENHYININRFLQTLESASSPSWPWKCSKDELLAPEFVISIGLQWCFDIRQPFRALEGFVYELFDLIRTGEPGNPEPTTSAYVAPNVAAFKDGMTPTRFFWLTLQGELASTGRGLEDVHENVIKEIHTYTRGLLKTEVPIHSGLCFRFTPPQLAMAAFAVKPVGRALIKSYLSVKSPENPRGVAKLMGVMDEIGKELRVMEKLVAKEFRERRSWEEGFRGVKEKVDAWRKVVGEVDFVERDRQRKMERDGIEKVKPMRRRGGGGEGRNPFV